MKGTSRLWTRLAVVTAAVAMSVIVVMGGGLSLYAAAIEYRAQQAMPASVRARLAELDQNPDANVAAIDELYRRYADEPPLSELVGLLLVLGVTGGGVAVSAAVLFSRYVAQPVTSVGEAARLIRQGNLQARASYKGVSTAGAEIAALVEDFNALASALEDSERRLREDAAAIAHELRTPLAILTARLQGLIDGVLTAGEREHIMLLRQVETLSKIVDDLRTISLANAGQLRINLEPVDLATVVADLLPATESQALSAGMGLSHELRSAKAMADADRVRQIVGNLVDNAVRYAAQGGELRIETEETSGRAILRVLDRGPGLTEDVVEEIFRPFFRADASRSRASGGTGLGLAVVAAIVAAHEGHVSAANRPRGGVEFRIEFMRSQP
jgi:two-component system sensor histidine kinase AdeS